MIRITNHKLKVAKKKKQKREKMVKREKTEVIAAKQSEIGEELSYLVKRIKIIIVTP